MVGPGSPRSWGWAPYHYGRWVSVGNSWGWVPRPHGIPRPPGRDEHPTPTTLQPSWPSSEEATGASASPSAAVAAASGGSRWPRATPTITPGRGPSRPRTWSTRTSINNSVTVVNYNNFSNGPVDRIRVDRDMIRRAPVMGHRVIGITPDRGSLAPYPRRQAIFTQAIPRRPYRTVIW